MLKPGLKESASRASQTAAEASGNTPWRRTVAEWSLTLVAYLFVTTCVVRGNVIPTSSMENTLLVGDHLFVDKLAYAPRDPWLGALLPYQEIERGDIIVFHYPLDINELYVKRAMGVPGDRLRIVNKQLIVNGQALREPYKIHKTSYIDSYRDNFPSEPNTVLPPRAMTMLRDCVRKGELVVPAGFYFAMGDNRDDSSDSRYWGLVPRDNIVGKPVLIYWSFDAPTDDLLEPFSPAHMADVVAHFFTKTRWERTFQRVKPYHQPQADDEPRP